MEDEPIKIFPELGILKQLIIELTVILFDWPFALPWTGSEFWTSVAFDLPVIQFLIFKANQGFLHFYFVIFMTSSSIKSQPVDRLAIKGIEALDSIEDGRRDTIFESVLKKDVG